MQEYQGILRTPSSILIYCRFGCETLHVDRLHHDLTINQKKSKVDPLMGWHHHLFVKFDLIITVFLFYKLVE